MSTGRPRILVTTHLFPVPGAPLKGPWVAEQVDALQDHAEVSVLAVSQHPTGGEETRGSGVHVTFRPIGTVFGRGRVGLLASSVRYARALRRVLRDTSQPFDLVHAHFGFPDAVVAAQEARRVGLPLVVTLHGDDAFRVLNRPDALGRRVRDAVVRARTTICVSEHMRRRVAETVPEARTITIGNGYDDRLFTLSTAPRTGIAFVGLLTAVKNVDVLVRAYAAKADEIGEDLVIAGDGPLRNELEALAHELGVGGRVRFTGLASREQTADLMKHSRTLVLPSSSEGWPLVVCEALACGTPVVASRVGGIPEIVASADAGLLVEPGDEAALANALVQAARTEWQPERVKAGSGAVSISSQAEQIARVYREAIEGGSAS